MEHDYETLISTVMDEKPIDFNDSFNNIILDKLQHAINNKKIAIAHNMFRDKHEQENINLDEIEEE